MFKNSTSKKVKERNLKNNNQLRRELKTFISKLKDYISVRSPRNYVIVCSHCIIWLIIRSLVRTFHRRIIKYLPQLSPQKRASRNQDDEKKTTTIWLHDTYNVHRLTFIKRKKNTFKVHVKVSCAFNDDDDDNSNTFFFFIIPHQRVIYYT